MFLHLMNKLFPIALVLLLAACSKQAVSIEQPPITSAPKEAIDILCLGDSYTKGESVVWTSNFPNQLKDSLGRDGFTLLYNTPRVIAQTGWRTDQLKTAITNATDIRDSIFSIVTLCIGVNNQYQNTNFSQYAPDFEALLQTAIARAGGRKERVFVVSIPDWAYTPYGENFPGNAVVSAKIDEYNAVNQQISMQYGVSYIQVTDVSREGLDRPELVANDGLHPSAQQYTEWVKLMLPVVRTALR